MKRRVRRETRQALRRDFSARHVSAQFAEVYEKAAQGGAGSRLQTTT
jgi:hypothetical protein